MQHQVQVFLVQATPSSFQFCFYYMAQVDNAGDYTNTADVVRSILSMYDVWSCLLLKYEIFTGSRTPGVRKNLSK